MFLINNQNNKDYNLQKENRRLKNEVISLTQMIEELRKSIHNESNPANKHSSENADLNYRFVFFQYIPK